MIEKFLTKDINLQFVTRETLNKISGTTDHQSVVGYAGPMPIRNKFFDANKQKFLIMLDRIQDPRNLGAIIRSSYCTGVQGIILTNKSSSPLTAVALKSAAGLAEYMEFYQANSAASAMIELKKAGYNIFASTIAGADIRKITFDFPACIIIGNEAEGIDKNILSQTTQVSLPQIKTDISYNASVAAGIFLFHVSTQQQII